MARPELLRQLSSIMSSSGMPSDISEGGEGEGKGEEKEKDAKDRICYEVGELSSGVPASESQPTNKPALKLPFFRFPPEIRFIIYRKAWTVDPKPHTVKKSGQLRIDYVKEQLSVVAKLGAVSRQMRIEAYSEFFHRTQAYFRWNTQMQGFSKHNVQVMARMQGSFLLKYHLQHVSLYWPENYEHRLATLRWLEGLEQLKTLKIVISNGPDLENRKGAHYSVNAMRRLPVSLARRNAKSEKPFVIFESDRPELVNLWNDVDWFRSLVEDVANHDAEPPRQIIEQHLGCLNPLWAKSLAYRI